MDNTRIALIIFFIISILALGILTRQLFNEPGLLGLEKPMNIKLSKETLEHIAQQGMTYEDGYLWGDGSDMHVSIHYTGDPIIDNEIDMITMLNHKCV